MLIWIIICQPQSDQNVLKIELKALKENHSLWRQLTWTKVSAKMILEVKWGLTVGFIVRVRIRANAASEKNIIPQHWGWCCDIFGGSEIWADGQNHKLDSPFGIPYLEGVRWQESHILLSSLIDTCFKNPAAMLWGSPNKPSHRDHTGSSVGSGQMSPAEAHGIDCQTCWVETLQLMIPAPNHPRHVGQKPVAPVVHCLN